MQIVSSGDNLHECQTLFSGKKLDIIYLSFAEFAQRVLKVKQFRLKYQ